MGPATLQCVVASGFLASAMLDEGALEEGGDVALDGLAPVLLCKDQGFSDHFFKCFLFGLLILRSLFMESGAQASKLGRMGTESEFTRLNTYKSYNE